MGIFDGNGMINYNDRDEVWDLETCEPINPYAPLGDDAHLEAVVERASEIFEAYLAYLATLSPDERKVRRKALHTAVVNALNEEGEE